MHSGGKLLKTDESTETTRFVAAGSATLADILEKKGTEVVTVDHESPVSYAVKQMCLHKVGSVVVVECDKPVGLFTERDLMHRIVNEARNPDHTPLGMVMTAPFAVAKPELCIREAAELMSDNRIRHLPVSNEGRLIGMISSGDILAWKLAEQELSMKFLENYFFLH